MRLGSRKGAFTIIELLIVIVIIAIIAGLLFPVFSGARERARRATCVNNLRELGMALQQYLTEHDRYFPPVYYVGVEYNFTCPWFDLLSTYTKKRDLGRCPSDTGSGRVSYVYNQFLCNSPRLCLDDGSPIVESPGEHLYVQNGVGDNWTEFRAGVEFPHKVVAFTDWVSNDGSALALDIGTRPSPLITDPQLLKAMAKSARRHGNAANYCFVDGHVEWYKPDVIKEDSTGGTGTNNVYDISDPCPNVVSQTWYITNFPVPAEGGMAARPSAGATGTWTPGPDPSETHPTFNPWW